MTILLTGGAGRTTTAIAHRLRQAELPFIVLSRSGGAGTDFDVCRFDWLDATTWSMPFQQVTATGRPPISALYVVVGGLAMPEVATPIMEFIDFAKARGVYRFVLLSQSDIEPGGQNMGLVHHHVVSLEPEVEYVVLRPTWFMDNFSKVHLLSIRNENKIYSAAEDGKIPWISCDDVGAVGFHALVGKWAITDSDPILLGPELLTYDEVAAILTQVIGRKITHVRLSVDAYRARLASAGLPPLWVKILSNLDVDAANGVEDRLNDNFKRITGQNAITFREWAEQNKSAWL